MINLDWLKFNDFDDFIKNHKELRIYYILLTQQQKREYKNYIYSLGYKEMILDIIWEFYNEPKMSCDYVYEYQLENLYKMYQRNNKVFNK